MARVHYFAYGSNLHPLRLNARVPGARVVGTAELPGHRIAFHKRSVDGSGKCLLYRGQSEAQSVHGVVYELDQREKALLDSVEGKNRGYTEEIVRVSLRGALWKPYLYLAQSSHIDPSLFPYHWYKGLVLAGARYHDFPAEYVGSIEATPSFPDPDIERAEENEALLKRMTG